MVPLMLYNHFQFRRKGLKVVWLSLENYSLKIPIPTVGHQILFKLLILMLDTELGSLKEQQLLWKSEPSSWVPSLLSLFCCCFYEVKPFQLRAQTSINMTHYNADTDGKDTSKISWFKQYIILIKIQFQREPKDDRWLSALCWWKLVNSQPPNTLACEHDVSNLHKMTKKFQCSGHKTKRHALSGVWRHLITKQWVIKTYNSKRQFCIMNFSS